MARAVCGPNGASRPLPPLPRHTVARPRIQGGGVTVFVTPAQERSNAVPVALDGLRRLALGAQRQLPRRQQSGQIESGWLATRHPDISTGYAVVVYYFWIDR